MIPGIIMGFREGLEAFLVIAIMLRYISKIKQDTLKIIIWQGVLAGIILSVGLGIGLNILSTYIGNLKSIAKLWESIASLIALGLVTTFIFWMINHGRNMTQHVENQVEYHLSKAGIFFVALIMVAREGAEIAIFTFAGKFTLSSVSFGIIGALILTTLIFYSLIKVDIKTIFNITLAYLVLQAGFLLGYGIHEGISALKDLGYLSKDSFLFIRVFNLSGTVFNHKQGIAGLPLYVLFGWYSKPEWIQFLAQYMYTFGIFGYWLKKLKGTKDSR